MKPLFICIASAALVCGLAIAAQPTAPVCPPGAVSCPVPPVVTPPAHADLAAAQISADTENDKLAKLVAARKASQDREDKEHKIGSDLDRQIASERTIVNQKNATVQTLTCKSYPVKPVPTPGPPPPTPPTPPVPPTPPTPPAPVGLTLLAAIRDNCPACDQLAPEIQTLKADGYKIETINITKDPGAGAKWKITAVPTLVILWGGKETVPVTRNVGYATEASLKVWIEQVRTWIQNQGK